MKTMIAFIFLLSTSISFAQKHTRLPHGMVFGSKPGTVGLMSASKLETFMGKRTRISTSIEGKVIKVTKTKGGWFDLDAGNGKVIAAHFKDYSINIPAALKGKTVIIEGVAQKQFIADDLQHLAGDTVHGKKQHRVKTSRKHRLTFEVTGLMIDK